MDSAEHSRITDESGETLIVGAGVIGVCIAHYLLEAGGRPVIVDRGGVAAGASYANAGLIVPSSWRPLTRPGVERDLPAWMLNADGAVYAPLGAMVRHCPWWLSFLHTSRPELHARVESALQNLAASSVQLYGQITEEFQLDCQFRAQGTVSLFLSEEALREGAEHALQHRAGGGAAALLDRTAVRHLVPQASDRVAGGVLFPEDGQVSPGDFVRELAASAVRRGARLLTETEVLDFETAGGRIVAARTTRGRLPCDQVVMAAGAWSRRLGKATGLNIPVEQAKGYSYTIPRPAEFPDMGISLSEGQAAINPLRDQVRVAGTLEFSGMDDALYARRAELLNVATRTFLDLDCAAAAVEIWRGWRPMTPDGLPVIQWSPRHSNLLVATGHNKIGMTLAPLTGQLAAEMLTGAADGWQDADLTLNRFAGEPSYLALNCEWTCRMAQGVVAAAKERISGRKAG